MKVLHIKFTIHSSDQRLKPYRILQRTLQNKSMQVGALFYSFLVSAFFIFFCALTAHLFPGSESIGSLLGMIYFGFYTYEAVVICKGKQGTVLSSARFLPTYLSLASTDGMCIHYDLLLKDDGIVLNDAFIPYGEIEKVRTARSGHDRFTIVVLKYEALDLLWWHTPSAFVSQYCTQDIILIPLDACTEEEREDFFTILRAHTPLGTVQFF